MCNDSATVLFCFKKTHNYLKHTIHCIYCSLTDSVSSWQSCSSLFPIHLQAKLLAKFTCPVPEDHISGFSTASYHKQDRVNSDLFSVFLNTSLWMPQSSQQKQSQELVLAELTVPGQVQENHPVPLPCLTSQQWNGPCSSTALCSTGECQSGERRDWGACSSVLKLCQGSVGIKVTHI